jgi:transposase
MGKIERIQVAPEDRERLVKLVKDRNTPQKIVWRSQIVLFAGEGIGAVEVATRVGKSVLTVRRWRRRYASKGVDGLLKDATRPPGRKPLTARKIKQVVNLTLNDKPPDATHWSERTMAARTGIAPSSVHKIWAAHGLKPHLSKTFKLSRDPNFVAKVEDIVGLYLNPPDKALVLAVDEKSQIQALDRTQPGLPMNCGSQHARRHSHRPMHAPPPASRVPPLSQDHRRTDSAQSRPASHRRQLCHPQDPCGKALAQAAFALSLALYAHFGLVAQHGRAVLCRDHQKTHSPRRLQERRRIEASHHGLSQSPQRQPEALRLDKDRRQNLQ